MRQKRLAIIPRLSFALVAYGALEPLAFADPYEVLRSKSLPITSDELQRRIDLVLSRCRGRLDREARAACTNEATVEYDTLKSVIFRATARASLGKYDFEKKRFPVYVFAELGRAVKSPAAPGWSFPDRDPPIFQTYLTLPDASEAAALRARDREVAAEVLIRFASPYQLVRDTGTVDVDLLGVIVLGPDARVLAASPGQAKGSR